VSTVVNLKNIQWSLWIITIPNALIYDLIQHPYFQRCARISQMGLSYLVLSGSKSHSFSSCFRLHAFNAKQLMFLRFKGVIISSEEENAFTLLYYYDIGHVRSHHSGRSIIRGCASRTNSFVVHAPTNKVYINDSVGTTESCCNWYPVNWIWIEWIIWSEIVFYLVYEGNNWSVCQKWWGVVDVMVLEEKEFILSKSFNVKRLMY
jgi:hypothetical protein